MLYEGLAALNSGDFTGGIRNGADVILKSAFFAIGGRWGPVAFGILLVLGTVFIIARDLKRSGERLKPWVFAAMSAESVVLALLVGGIVGGLTAQLLHSLPGLAIASPQHPQKLGLMTQMTVSLGAGLYEELLFRVLLTSGLAMAVRVVLGVVGGVGLVASVGSALIFSAFHYVGPYGDALALPSFAFRAIAGLFFSGLYLTRGFGVTAWTHALYDIFLLVG